MIVLTLSRPQYVFILLSAENVFCVDAVVLGIVAINLSSLYTSFSPKSSLFLGI